MKKYITGLLIALSCTASMAWASPAAPQSGMDYQVFAQEKAPSSSTPSDSKIQIPALKRLQNKQVVEVMEFFWYGCPHCATLESQLLVWFKQKGQAVKLTRVPVAFSKDFEAHQRLYHALVAMGFPSATISTLNAKIFKEIQERRNYLLTPEAQAQFLAEQGVNPTKFLSAYSSDAVTNAVAQDKVLTEKYNIDGVPALVVQNQYMTSPAMAGSLEGAVQILDFLVRKVQSQNGAK